MITATTIKERPIPFSYEMVKAILEGRKTKTRRICKLAINTIGSFTEQAYAVHPARTSGWIFWFGRKSDPGDTAEFTKQAYEHGFPCPYGAPGDRLWVKEALRRFGSQWVAYEAGNTPTDDPTITWRWKRDRLPPMFMPRELSRIILEIADVRVERIQDITPEDCVAEGIVPDIETHAGQYWREDAYADFRDLWERINGPRGYGWECNPWVWVVEFRRVTP